MSGDEYYEDEVRTHIVGHEWHRGDRYLKSSCGNLIIDPQWTPEVRRMYEEANEWIEDH